MIILTFDTDWAPPFVVNHVQCLLDRYNVSATIFCTSPYELVESNKLEIGLHPNLMADSTQGKNEAHILEQLITMYPKAESVRTHRLFWHGGLPSLFSKYCLKNDSSIILPYHSNIEVSLFGQLNRLPFWWGDNFHLLQRYSFEPLNDEKLVEPGIKVFNFHPIHVYLNTRCLQTYRKKVVNIKDLYNYPESKLKALRNPGIGIRNYLISLLEYCRHYDEANFTFKNAIQAAKMRR